MNVADNHRISLTIAIFLYVTLWITQSVSGQALFGRNSPSNFMFVSPSRYGASNPNAPSGEIIHKSSLPAKNQVQYAGAGASLKPGYCPSVVLITSTKCADLCGDDNDCVGMKKCCRNGCGKRCIDPVHQAQNPPSQHQVQNSPPQQQAQNAPPQQQAQNAPPQQQAQNVPLQQETHNPSSQHQTQNHLPNHQTQNAPTGHQQIINNKPDLFPGVPPSQLYGANHLPNTVNGGPMFHGPNSSAPHSEATYNQRNQPNVAEPSNYYQQQQAGTNGPQGNVPNSGPQGNVPNSGTVGSFYPPSTSTNGQHQINEIQGQSHIPQSTINSHPPAANNPWTSNAQSPSFPGHIGGQAPGYDPASHTIQGGGSNGQHRTIQIGGSQNQTAGNYPQSNHPSGSNPSYQYNGLPNGNGQPNLNNPPPYSAPNGPNNPSLETYNQVSGSYDQQFSQPGSYNPSQPYHAATGGSSYRPVVPNNQYSNPVGGLNSVPYQQQVSGGTSFQNFTTDYLGGAYHPPVQQRHQQQHTERANSESVSHVENPMGQTGPGGNLHGPHQNLPGQNQFVQGQNPSEPYQNRHSRIPNRPTVNQNEPLQNGFGQSYNGPYRNEPSRNLIGSYQNGANQNPSGPYQNGPSHNPSGPYQNGPSQNPSGPYQNGPSQNPSGPYQNGHSQNPSGPYQNGPVHNEPNINKPILNTNGPYQNAPMQSPNSYHQSGPIPNQNGPQQIGPRNNLNESHHIRGHDQFQNEAYQNGPRPFPNRPHQNVHNHHSSEPYQNKPSQNYNTPLSYQNGSSQNGPGQNQNGQSPQSNSPYLVQTPNSFPNIPGQEGLPNSPYNEPRRTEPPHRPQHKENTRNTQYNSAGAVYPHQQIAHQKAQRTNNVLQIRPYKVGKENSVVEILPYDGESSGPLQIENTQNYNQDQYHHEQTNQEPTNAVQYPQNSADNTLYSQNTGPPENMMQQVGEPEGIQQVQPEGSDIIPESAVKLKPSIYGSYKIIPYDMRKYGKSKPMMSNLYGQGIGFNMNSNAPTEVKAPETIPKPARGVGPWPVGYDVTSRVHPGNSVQNQAFNTRQPKIYSNIEPKIPVEIKQTNQHQQENRGVNARTTAGIAPRWFRDNTVSYQDPKDVHTAGPEFPVPAVDKRVTYPEVELPATIKHPSSSSKNKEVSPTWNRKGKEPVPQISLIPVQNALNTPAVEPKVGPREPESITKSPSFTNMVHTNGEPSSNKMNNFKQGQIEQTSVKPAGSVRDPGVNQKGDVTPGPSIKPSSNVVKSSFHDPHRDMNPMNSITYKDTRFGKNYYDPVMDQATHQEVNHHNHFESVHSRTRPRNTFSLMGGDPNPAGDMFNSAPPLQYNAANLGIVDYGQPRASAFEAQPVRRERMSLSARGDSSYGSGLSISRIYHDVGHSRAIMEPPTPFEFSSEFKEATAKPTYRPPIDSLGQVYIDIARFPDNPMKAPPNPLSLSMGFRGHIPDLLTTLPPLDKSTPKETPISYIEKKTTDAVSPLNLLEPPKTEKPAEPKKIIPDGMALTETGSQPKQMAPGSASQSSHSAPRLGISSTLIGAPPTNTGPEKKVFNRDGFNLFTGYKPQYKVPVKEIRNPSVRGAPVFSARAGKTLKKQ